NSGMDDYLAKALERMNSMSPQELDMLLYYFDLSMYFNLSIFGRHAFRKSLWTDQEDYKSQFNMSLFEVCSVLFSSERWKIYLDVNEVKSKFKELLSNQFFVKSISSSTHKSYNVKRRFEMVEKAFGGLE
ncbi:MAG: DUF262 domain-containing protein, partial [Magnetococcales bacterium]|nr:DUF262 domain-containing protein [Magnetococcales bacterium]